MKLTIQNMVCDRCLESVRNILDDTGVEFETVELGEVTLKRILSDDEKEQLASRLNQKGFALIQDRESELIERIKVNLLDYLHYLEQSSKPKKLSVFLAENLHYNYSYLSKLFSDKTGETVEGYLIKLKIERVKELLSYRSLTLSEIAWKLKYSSVQYLSNQFKKITGKTVTEYLSQEKTDRKTIDRI